MCMYTCIYTCVCKHVYVYMCIYVWVYAHECNTTEAFGFVSPAAGVRGYCEPPICLTSSWILFLYGCVNEHIPQVSVVCEPISHGTYVEIKGQLCVK